jgi:hypothetical protein
MGGHSKFTKILIAPSDKEGIGGVGLKDGDASTAAKNFLQFVNAVLRISPYFGKRPSLSAINTD